MGRQRRGVVAGVCLSLLLASAGSASADPEAVRQAEEELREATQRAGAAQADLDRIGERVSLAVEAYNESQERFAHVRAEAAAEVEAVNAVQARIRRHEAEAGSLARRLYRTGPAYELEALLGAGSATDVHLRLVYLRSAAREQLNAVHALEGDRRVHTAQLDRLAEVRAEAARREQELAARKQAVERLLAAQAAEVQELRDVVAAAEAQHEAAVSDERERLERERLDRQRREREALERARQAAAREAAARQVAEGVSGAPAAAGEAARVAVDAALSQVGKPYRWGVEGPDAYDCSGLTKWAWEKAGVHLPHSSRMQYASTRRVPRSDLRPGDLLFFGSPIHHVAMYIGDGQVVEAPYSGSHVRVNDRAVHRSDLVGIGRPRG